MFSNSRGIPMEYIMRTLYSSDRLLRRNYKSILLNANIKFVILALSNVLRELPLPKASDSMS